MGPWALPLNRTILAPLTNRMDLSKFAWGMSAIATSLGARFVVSDLTTMQQSYLATPLFKRVVIFCIIMTSTRDLVTSAVLAFSVIMVLEVFANEAHSWCMLPRARPAMENKKVASAWEQNAPPPIMRALSPGAGHAIESALGPVFEGVTALFEEGKLTQQSARFEDDKPQAAQVRGG